MEEKTMHIVGDWLHVPIDLVRGMEVTFDLREVATAELQVLISPQVHMAIASVLRRRIEGRLPSGPVLFEPAEETGWVLEELDSPTSEPHYFSTAGIMFADKPCFSPDHLKALRFARREDAEAFARCYGQIEFVRICEHRWS